ELWQQVGPVRGVIGGGATQGAGQVGRRIGGGTRGRAEGRRHGIGGRGRWQGDAEQSGKAFEQRVGLVFQCRIERGAVFERDLQCAQGVEKVGQQSLGIGFGLAGFALRLLLVQKRRDRGQGIGSAGGRVGAARQLAEQG